MHEVCHTCGGELASGAGESPFCPHCGTPQLTLSLDYQSVETGGEGEPLAPGAATAVRRQRVDWKMAIRCAAIVAGVAAALSVGAIRMPILLMACVAWVMSGSLIAMGLYQKRRPLAHMDAGIGARIGVVVGISVAVGLTGSMGVAGMVARFGLHAMGGFDSQLGAIFQKVMEQSAQQSGSTLPPEMWGLIRSQEFRAGYALFCIAMVSGFVLGMSVLFGAFAGLVRMRRTGTA